MTAIERILEAVLALAPRAEYVRKDEDGADRVEEVVSKQSEHRGEVFVDFGDGGKYRVIAERWNG